VANKTTQPAEDSTEILEPSAQLRTIHLGVEPNVKTYVQKPLSFFGKMEIFSVLGGALDKAMSGDDGLSLNELLNGPGELGGSVTAENFRDADTFVKAIGKLLQYAPDLFLDLYVVILAVPRGEREVVKEQMRHNEEDGGLSDDDGFGILETFIDQNWDVMADFFGARIQPLIEKVSNKVQGSQQSKP
jgi:hypothetical protein